MWAQTCETATYVLNRTGKTCYQEISNRYVEWSSDEELGSKCVRHRVLCVHLKQFRKKFNKNVFGRMIRYLNDKGGYQVYVPSLKKTAHSHVYFKSEPVCISLVVETGLENAVAEDVVAVNRKKDDTML